MRVLSGGSEACWKDSQCLRDSALGFSPETDQFLCSGWGAAQRGLVLSSEQEGRLHIGLRTWGAPYNRRPAVQLTRTSKGQGPTLARHLPLGGAGHVDERAQRWRLDLDMAGAVGHRTGDHQTMPGPLREGGPSDSQQTLQECNYCTCFLTTAHRSDASAISTRRAK